MATTSAGPQVVRDDQLVPVVIVTARLAAENRIESFDAGADDYVPKPYTPDQIFEALEQSDAWKDQLDTPRLEGEVALDGATTARPSGSWRSSAACCRSGAAWSSTRSTGSARPSRRSGRASTPGRASDGWSGWRRWPTRSPRRR